MWLFVMFDLPVMTKKERKDATLFRKNLEKDGFFYEKRDIRQLTFPDAIRWLVVV